MNKLYIFILLLLSGCSKQSYLNPNKSHKIGDNVTPNEVIYKGTKFKFDKNCQVKIQKVDNLFGAFGNNFVEYSGNSPCIKGLDDISFKEAS